MTNPGGQAPRFRAISATHEGRVRDHNEDAVEIAAVTNRNGLYHLWVVADGMGGGVRGEVASREAIRAVVGYFASHPDWFNPADSLRDALKDANAAVHELGTGNGAASKSSMGTTLTVVLLHDVSGKFHWANVGDSRVYVAGPGGLRQLSDDHSLVAERVRAGLMGEREARASANRNVLTRAIGIDANVEPDVSEQLELAAGEALVLCSDGVHGMLNDARLARLLRAPIGEDVATRIVDAANRAGGHDNATVLVGALAEDVRPLVVPAMLPWWRLREALVAAAAVLPWWRRREALVAAAGAVVAVAGVAVAAALLLRSEDGPSPSIPRSSPTQYTSTAGPTQTATVTPSTTNTLSPSPTVGTGGASFHTVAQGESCAPIARQKAPAGQYQPFLNGIQLLNPQIVPIDPPDLPDLRNCRMNPGDKLVLPGRGLLPTIAKVDVETSVPLMAALRSVLRNAASIPSDLVDLLGAEARYRLCDVVDHACLAQPGIDVLDASVTKLTPPSSGRACLRIDRRSEQILLICEPGP